LEAFDHHFQQISGVLGFRAAPGDRTSMQPVGNLPVAQFQEHYMLWLNLQ
jgi:hypothetical protein